VCLYLPELRFGAANLYTDTQICFTLRFYQRLASMCNFVEASYKGETANELMGIYLIMIGKLGAESKRQISENVPL
jgi:hypothetical protein